MQGTEQNLTGLRVRLRNSRPQSAGFTLAEAMVATLLLGTLVVSLYAGMSAGFAYTAMVREELRATQVMLEKLEGIRLYNWEQINTSGFIPTNFTAFYLPNPTNPATGSGVVYTGTLTIQPVRLDPSPPYADDLREVVVRLRWVSGNGNPAVVREREMRTLVSRYGLQNYIFSN